MRTTSAFKKIIESIEKKKKILYSQYKSAYLHLPDKNEDFFFEESVPEDFNEIKM